MPRYVIVFDTDRGPGPTEPVDYLALVGVLLFWGFCAAVLWRVYQAAAKQQYAARTQVIATTLMCAGAAIHVLATFVGNGHLESFEWFLRVQNMHCPLWDFWGRFVCGFSVWFFGLMLHQMYWIRTLSDLGAGDADVELEQSASAKSQLRGSGYVFAGPTNSTTQSYGSFLTQRFLTARVVGVFMFGVITAIALAVELTHGTTYNPEHHSCYTVLWVKIVLTAWIFTSMGALIWMLIVLRRKTRHIGFLRVCSGLDQSQRLLYACTGTLLILLSINMSGLLTYSVPRTVYTLTLAAMYAYSIYTMHVITKILCRADDNVERAAKCMTFSTVWNFAALRSRLLRYVECAASERDLRYAAGVNKLLVSIRVQDTRDRKHTLYRKLHHPGTALETMANASYAENLADASGEANFCIADEEDDAFEDGESGEKQSNLYDNVLLAENHEFDAQEQESVTHVSRKDLCRFIRAVYGVDQLTKQSPRPPSSRVLSVASRIVSEFFPVNLSRPAQAAASETLEGIEAVVDGVPSDSALPPPADGFGDSEESVQQLYLNIERTCTLAALERNQHRAQVIPFQDFLEMIPDRKRLQHLVSADVSDLHAVYDVIISGSVNRVNTVLQFIYAMQTVCRTLIETHYYPRALCNTDLAQQYERMLRERIASTGTELSV